MEKQDPMTTIQTLLVAAHAAEAEAIVEVAIRTKFMWRCANPKDEFGVLCGWVSPIESAKCETCGAERPHELDGSAPLIHVLWHGVTLCGKSLEGTTWVSLSDRKNASCGVCTCRADGYDVGSR